MVAIDRGYILAALIMLIVGVLNGFYMGITGDTGLRAVHLTLLLPGFVTLAIFGFIYRLWPTMKSAPLAQTQFWLMTVGTFAGAVESYHFVKTGSIAIVLPSSLLMAAAMAILCWQFWSHSEA